MESVFDQLVVVFFYGPILLLDYVLSCLREVVYLFKFGPLKWTFQSRNGDTKLLTYQEWYAQQEELDQSRNVYAWASFSNHPGYNYRALEHFRHELRESQRRDDYHHVCSRLRAQLDRNIYKILAPKLYRKSLIQTKHAIHEYIEDMKQCIRYIVKWKGQPANQWSEKDAVLYEVKESVFGRTTLVLTGGAMVSACHIGVVKVLFQHHLLPRIITGVATGSLIAAMVATSTDPELRILLQLREIKLDAFEEHKKGHREGPWYHRMWATIQRRSFRYSTTNHIFDIDVLRQFAKDNLGDTTFDEAYQKTGRILNIVIAMSDTKGTPQLLNYITAPHVIIWSAVVASIATSHEMYAPPQLYCKSRSGSTAEFRAPDTAHHRGGRGCNQHPQPPLQRLAELFNVNNFVISQTRPYVFPFIWAQRATVDTPALGKLVRFTINEGLHCLTRLIRTGLLPSFIHRALMDEAVPSSADTFAKLHITPQVKIRDLFSMFELPTVESLQKWSRVGEESTWPFLCQLDIRCTVEFEMDRAFDSVNRRKDSLIF